jgi:hypothetical protein
MQLFIKKREKTEKTKHMQSPSACLALFLIALLVFCLGYTLGQCSQCASTIHSDSRSRLTNSYSAENSDLNTEGMKVPPTASFPTIGASIMNRGTHLDAEQTPLSAEAIRALRSAGWWESAPNPNNFGAVTWTLPAGVHTLHGYELRFNGTQQAWDVHQI